MAGKSLHVGETPGAESWLRPYETRGTGFYKHPELCEAHGLSIFASKSDLDTFRDFNPQLRKKSIARVDITASDGVVLPLPVQYGDSHHDWWTDPVGLLPNSTVIEEGY